MPSLPSRIVFMGTPDFALPSLEALLASGVRPLAVFTQPDKPAGRGRGVTPPPVKRYALAQGLDICQPATLKDPEVIADLRALQPDLIAVAAYGKILPPAILEIPPLGCINVHASLLPRHRGASPIAHAIWNGDREVGISIMRMEAGLDTGPVFMSRGIPAPQEATTGTLTPLLARLGADLLIATLKGIEAGILMPEPQDDAMATLAPRLKAEQGRLDFSRPAVQLERQVRAFHPWPGTYFEYSGERIKVHSVSIGSETSLPPGEVLALPGLSIACGDGRVLVLETIQRAGKRPLSASEVLHGFKIPPGSKV
jgi:methionyl-tRNA formyltransferase